MALFRTQLILRLHLREDHKALHESRMRHAQPLTAAEPQHGAATVRPRPWRLLSARVALRTQPAHLCVQGAGNMGHDSLNT